jgi:hypothetical protein
MKIRHFVSGSSAIITFWLAVTFVYQVPVQRYPSSDKSPTVAIPKTSETASETADAEKIAVVQVSVSR